MLNVLLLIAVFSLLGRRGSAEAKPAQSAQAINPYQVPEELWSPLVASKFYTTAKDVSSTQYPQFTDRTQGYWVNYGTDYWTSGFLPVALYAMQKREELCPSVKSGINWLDLGRRWSNGLHQLEVRNTVGHDVGFIAMPFMEELARNPYNLTAENSIKAFAKILKSRYSSVTGLTRSWDDSDPSTFRVIIDNMMNLELFFIAEQLTGDSYFRTMAISHADKTLANHIRPDGGSYHVVYYNGTSGKVYKRGTSQGYSDDSTWTRGQAWGLYGFANMHRRTLNNAYLNMARKMGTYFLSNMPSNGIVPWDFQAPVPSPPSPPVKPADSSAAMIATAGMLLLAHQEGVIANTSGQAYWSAQAMNLYYNNIKSSWKPSWASLLANGTVNNPANNNLTGIIYGDYYMVENGNTLIQMGLAQCP